MDHLVLSCQYSLCCPLNLQPQTQSQTVYPVYLKLIIYEDKNINLDSPGQPGLPGVPGAPLSPLGPCFPVGPLSTGNSTHLLVTSFPLGPAGGSTTFSTSSSNYNQYKSAVCIYSDWWCVMSLLPLLPGGPGGPGEPCLPGGPNCPFTPEAHKQAALLKLHCPMKTVISHSGSFHSNRLFFSIVFNLQLRYFLSHF